MKLNNKGATSVLIILLMVVLMVFGLTILTTTLSNKSLSEKKQEWLYDYYSLESNVAETLAEVDHRLDELKKEAQINKLDLKTVYQDQLDMTVVDEKYVMAFDVSESAGNYLKHILIEIELLMDEDIAKKNFKIVKYSETQDLFEYEDIKFGNPFFPNED